ncbi:MAG TPA: biotin--[acetyl-CoA-carboxylase] ligase [Petrimonas sp.]|uniref:biotin--[acetyl-CoA-carboxylase] ligase n=1 Tax=Petrimonas sp. TaxID=2023866 RepID=UPI001753F2CC|nr:biotin--[acetyl-CoA-carboxylase] ligase [Petrimonas sp.]HHV85450.1 biotin--[acetyl-CoA-carboxylase] ligase [Petrimonas sp.]
MEQLSNGRQIIRLEETESTNSYLRDLLKSQHLEEGSVVVADFQTAGRGQVGNSWYSDKGDNLLFSLLIYPTGIPANEQFIISRMVSLAIKNTLDQFADDIRIKWPNDIYWKEKKIAGILIENSLQGKIIENSIIGIGLNLNQQIFPVELPNPVSLRQITATEQDKNYILDLLLKEFFLLYRSLQQGEKQVIEDEYMLDLYRANGYYWYEDANGRFQAEIDNVLPSGHLVLRTLDTNEERIYAFKEVQFI